MHLLSSDKISFSMAIWRKCLEHSYETYRVSATSLQLKFPGISFFSSILGIETFFFGWFLEVFSVVLMKDRSSHVKNRKV